MPDLERNKEVVRAFVTINVNEGDPQRAADLHMGPQYIQHDYGTADGKEAYVEALSARAKAFPDRHISIKRMLADGDLVALHSHLVKDADDTGAAAIDIFRVEDEKVVEHWCVYMPVPTEGDPVNENGIF